MEHHQKASTNCRISLAHPQPGARRLAQMFPTRASLMEGSGSQLVNAQAGDHRFEPLSIIYTYIYICIYIYVCIRMYICCEVSTFDQSSEASCLIPHASSRNISRSRHFHLQQIPKTFGSVSPWWSGGREQSWRHCSYWFGLLRSWCGLERPLCSQEPGQALVQLGSCDEPRYSSSWVENRRAQWSLGVGQGSTGVVQQEPLANHNLYIYIMIYNYI